MGKLISIVCYNQIELWHDRDNAIDFFKDCARNCEGAERDRYLNILWDLEDGEEICHDRSSFPYIVLHQRNWYYKTTAPDETRDYGNQIWYEETPFD